MIYNTLDTCVGLQEHFELDLDKLELDKSLKKNESYMIFACYHYQTPNTFLSFQSFVLIMCFCFEQLENKTVKHKYSFTLLNKPEHMLI